ncbi:MAG: hypothetical protein IJM97_02770 [Clostridia bacterium]|nr:hypothetical protein [Clostridia bacterium]
MRTKMTKIIASLMAIVLITSVFTACGDNNNDETTTTTNPSTVQSDATTDAGENTTEPVSENASSEDTSSNDTTDPSSEGTTKEGDPTTPNSTTNPVSTNSTEPTKPAKMPSTTAEIIKYYKDAAAKINSKKAGYTKTRETVTSKFDVPGIYLAVKDLIKGFMGIGKENIYTVKVAKGTSGSIVRTDLEGKEREYFFLPDVTLTAADLDSAKCVNDGKNYILTFDVKEGTSSAYKSDVKNNSPIDNAGVNSGNKDYDFFDHKTAAIMQNAIGSFIKNVKITEKTSNGKVVVTVDASTGNITNMVMTFDIYCEIKIIGDPIIASGTTTVKYENFKW